LKKKTSLKYSKSRINQSYDEVQQESIPFSYCARPGRFDAEVEHFPHLLSAPSTHSPHE